MSIPIKHFMPPESVVDVALQTNDELEDLLRVTSPIPIRRFEDPPESVDEYPTFDMDEDGKRKRDINS